jgi:hypothetical protein
MHLKLCPVHIERRQKKSGSISQSTDQQRYLLLGLAGN